MPLDEIFIESTDLSVSFGSLSGKTILLFNISFNNLFDYPRRISTITNNSFVLNEIMDYIKQCFGKTENFLSTSTLDTILNQSNIKSPLD